MRYLPGKTSVVAPRHATWNQVYERCPSTQQIFLAQFAKSMTGRIDYKTRNSENLPIILLASCNIKH